MNKKIWIGIAVVAVLLVGYFAFYRSSAPAEENAMSGMNADSSGATSSENTANVPGDNLTLGMSTKADLGTYLTAWNGMTLYTYSPDTAGVSNCSGQCAVNWPPYVITSTDNLVAESPIAGTISTLTRTDGSKQVTYNGAPLYFYIKDKNPNDTVGQGVGGVWYVVKP